MSEKELSDWTEAGGKVYYISHQMVVNPRSKMTPVRVVYNSSLSWKGQSLNTSWSMGPDLLNSLHGMLLWFREDFFTAQGDIEKMFYQVRIMKDKQFMQLWLWKFPQDANQDVLYDEAGHGEHMLSFSVNCGHT